MARRWNAPRPTWRPLKGLSAKLSGLEGHRGHRQAFRDAEERNAANGKDIERLLEAAAPPPGGPEPPTYPYPA
ncbi:hypothetical protein V2I01_05175 [Micromonospora sp. BRA006-A]|nr:hypothetical protein [Micromonospora sp. BRA006-A]